jgi:hypothetical protein
MANAVVYLELCFFAMDFYSHLDLINHAFNLNILR